uniref:Putative potassium transport system protein kup n=1 Tax=Lygus hesperus TaxID=30085 RepID=A0A0A9WTR3_LYGHE
MTHFLPDKHRRQIYQLFLMKALFLKQPFRILATQGALANRYRQRAALPRLHIRHLLCHRVHQIYVPRLVTATRATLCSVNNKNKKQMKKMEKKRKPAVMTTV